MHNLSNFYLNFDDDVGVSS